MTTTSLTSIPPVDKHSEVFQQLKTEGLELFQNLLKPQREDSVTKQASPTSYIARILENLWFDLEAKNTLKKSFFVGDKFLTYYRIFTLFVNTITFFWLILRQENYFHYMRIPSYLTNWGFFSCFAYSILVVAWSGVPDNNPRWRFAYLLGEMGFSLELMICPFYFAVLFPGEYPNMTRSQVAYDILIHFIVPVLIWLEVLFNDISFPPGHRFVIHMVVGTYLLNNALWTYFNEPVYGPIDWISTKSYVLAIGGALTVIGGFSLGGLIYRWKNDRILRKQN